MGVGGFPEIDVGDAPMVAGVPEVLQSAGAGLVPLRAGKERNRSERSHGGCACRIGSMGRAALAQEGPSFTSAGSPRAVRLREEDE
jgi:hypothetical protein